MLEARYVYNGVEGKMSLNISDFEAKQIDEIHDIDGEDLIEVVASKLEEKKVEIIYEINACKRGGERNQVPSADEIALKYKFSELSLHSNNTCVLNVR